ncbi:hypothetical protein [Leifsonia sp. NPDC077715]|uniref:hypothetical protein n=1 Tax=Leifsonia sp. NPDC077715 TaxID=3155539 RepID=UPI0034333A97
MLAASQDDESRAVEWKLGYEDLTSVEASFALSRAILGMANRSVPVAATAFEGAGYVVVGAEPGTLRGQTVPDSAELVNALRRFTGHGWPLWDGRTVDVDGTAVLVVTVEPPRDGDRIALLQKSYQPPKGPMVVEGTVFVRQPGSTERASKAELEMLQDRLVAGFSGREAELRADRNEKVRQLVAAAVGAAHRWADTWQIIVISTMKGRWEQRDWIEWFETDSGKQMVEDAQTIKHSARELRLLVTDRHFQNVLAIALDEFTSPEGFDGVHRDPSDDKSRVAAYAHIRAIKDAWTAVEEAAIEVLAA